MFGNRIINKIGKNVFYTIDPFHRLIIFGKGFIPNYLPKEPQTIRVEDTGFESSCFTYRYAPWSKDYVTEIIICRGIKRIGASAFSGMTAVHRVSIAGTVESVGKGSFKECSLISKMVFENDKAEIHPTALLGIDLCALKFKHKADEGLLVEESGLYHASRKELLIGANRHEIVIRDGTEVVNPYAFASHEKVRTVRCPDSLEIIGVSAFENCTSLKEIRGLSAECVLGRNSLHGTNAVRVYYDDSYLGSISEERPKVAISEHGSGHLRNGEFVFFAASDKTNIDPSVFYRYQDLIDIQGGENFLIGLRANGEVIYSDDRRCSEFFDIFDDSCSFETYDWLGRCHNWKEVCQIAAGKYIAAALREDGKVYCTGNRSGNVTIEFLNDIIYIEMNDMDVLSAVKANGEITRIDFGEED